MTSCSSSGAVVLATCNRFEAYLDIDEPLTGGEAVAVESVVEAMAAASDIPVERLRVVRRPSIRGRMSRPTCSP